MKFDPTRVNLHDTRMSMDLLHIEAIFEATKLLPYGKRAVEIGSYKGASTSALVQAMNCGYLSELHIVETHVKKELLDVLDGCKYRDSITIHKVPSWETDIGYADMVVIDGDHMWNAIRDLVEALKWRADIICAHDSILLPDTLGSYHVCKLLEYMPHMDFLHDNKQREGMKTERGLAIASRKEINLDPIRKCLKQ